MSMLHLPGALRSHNVGAGIKHGSSARATNDLTAEPSLVLSVALLIRVVLSFLKGQLGLEEPRGGDRE